jgi:UDP-N-acetylmuramate: L-alanyl-gamma-D-glutamyl-meso-diaminopimelate ligase
MKKNIRFVTAIIILNMRIHFIAIGGAAMHSLAIALKQKGHEVTGSDDEVFDPARSQLMKAGLLPAEVGWFANKITPTLDAVILGMHAPKDNPELQRALELGISIYSYPEFLYRETAGKTRVVIAGSHGKTTITAMVMHVLQHHGYHFDYMVGSRLDGFENMVSLSHDNNIAVFEGDEYLSSCLDPRPKFHLYQPQIALVSGIAWDHINVFPTWENYVEQFRIFIDNMPAGGYLVYCHEDAELKALAEGSNPLLQKEGYGSPEYHIENGVSCIRHDNTLYPMQVFGRHNMQNIQGALLICRKLGLNDRQFFEAIVHFKGAGKRLQLLGKMGKTAVFLDFAHSPSKVEATVKATKELFTGQKLVACLELHTFSSLNKKFLDHYSHTLDQADEAMVFFNPQTILHKRLEMIAAKDVEKAFNKPGLKVFTDRNELEAYLHHKHWENTVLLLMSSGNFSGINFKNLTDHLLCRIAK